MDKMHPAIKRYVKAVEKLTQRTCTVYEYGRDKTRCVTDAIELIMYFNDGGKPLKTILPDHLDELLLKAEELELMVGRVVGTCLNSLVVATDEYTGLCFVDTVTAVVEPSWVELETMKELV